MLQQKSTKKDSNYFLKYSCPIWNSTYNETHQDEDISCRPERKKFQKAVVSNENCGILIKQSNNGEPSWP